MAYESHHAVLFYSSVTTPSTTADALVGQIVDFNLMTGNAAVIDVTHLGSTAKEKLAGVPDMGQLTVNVNHDATDKGQAMCYSAMCSRAVRCVSMFLPQGNSTNWLKFDCQAYVVSMPITGGVDNKMSRSITFELTGIATIATVAAAGA